MLSEVNGPEGRQTVTPPGCACAIVRVFCSEVVGWYTWLVYSFYTFEIIYDNHLKLYLKQGQQGTDKVCTTSIYPLHTQGVLNDGQYCMD